MVIQYRNAMHKTDTLCPQSGNYVFVRHVDAVSCGIDHSGERIEVRKFDLFPSVRSCRKSAFWAYAR